MCNRTSEVAPARAGTTVEARARFITTLDEPDRTAYLLGVSSPDLFPRAPSDGCAAAGPFSRMVRRARLVAARASAGAAGKGARRPLGAADRAHRRRQDARGISADAGGTFLAFGGRWQERRLHRPRRQTHRRPAHALHLAAEGARRRHRAQSRNADRRDESADQGRDPHRRHAGVAAAAPARAIRRTFCSPRPSNWRCCCPPTTRRFCFRSLKRIVLDELHALVTSKRGDLLSLGLARLWRLAPTCARSDCRRPSPSRRSLARFLVPQPRGP